MGTVAEFEYGSNQADNDRCVKLVNMVMTRVVNVAYKKTKVQRHCQYDKKTKNNFF